jgi:hypothetical protein
MRYRAGEKVISEDRLHHLVGRQLGAATSSDFAWL